MTKYTTVSIKCSQCKKESIAEMYKTIQSKYGHGLISYVIYQMLVNGISLERIAQNLSDLFGLSIASSTLYSFKTIAANYYRESYQNLYSNILQGKLIHADETKVNLKRTSGYVWVFTNMESVIFVYRGSREGSFLHDFLTGFQGVLVTDYYAGYESLPFAQQKCLIHLIRDLNRDLFQNQLDEDLKSLAQQFTQLLQEIIQTVDAYGLKKRYLQKYKKTVESFFKKIKESPYTSEVAKNYQKRFEKNKDTLFTFLEYDGIPWNNNNAEHAFKHFATYRKMNNGIFTKSGIEDYLILLSIYQTCQYKNSNFLQFLLSKKKIFS